MAKIIIDRKKELGRVKPVNGVGQPPLLGARNCSMFRYLTEAGIPYSRLHDVGGPYGAGRYVDVPNIFRDFDADETLAESYDFAFTDVLIKGLVDAGVEPFFRLGVTIENDFSVRAYRIYPPKDAAKWARICEHIVRHYNEGWADGFHYGIKYWEIWNEPDDTADIACNPMWQGTKEQFFELYETSAKHLKARFPDIKVGGYGSCGFYEIAGGLCVTDHEIDTKYFVDFFLEFLTRARERDVPVDFFSWHSYDESVENNVKYMDFVRKTLDEYGFASTESILGEWNIEYRKRGTLRHAAQTAAMLLELQNGPADSAMFYDARCAAGIYGSMFNCIDRTPYPTYYAFTAFARLLRLGRQVAAYSDDGRIHLSAANDGRWLCLVIANPAAEEIPLDLSFAEGSAPLPNRFTVTDRIGVDRECYSLASLPPESIVSVWFDLT